MPVSHLPLSLLADFFILLSLTGLGLIAMKPFYSAEKASALILAAATGLFLFCTYIFIVTITGHLHFRVVAAGLGLSAIVGLPRLISFARPLLQTRLQKRPFVHLTPFEIALIGTLAVALISNLVFNYAPPTGEDELHYHISLPALFVYWGKWVKTPGVCSSFFPLNGEMLHTGVLCLFDVFAVKTMVWASGLLMIPALYIFARDYLFLERMEALFACVLFYTSPIITSYNGTTSVDMLYMFYVLSTTFLLWEWRAAPNGKILFFMGVLAGAGMGIRLYGAPWVLAVAVAIALLDRKPGAAVLFGLTAAFVYSPWWIRNYLATGNPMYPWPLWKGAAADPYQMSMLPQGGMLSAWFLVPFFTTAGGFIWGMGPLPWSFLPCFGFRESKKDILPLFYLALLILTCLNFTPDIRVNARYYDAAFPLIALLGAAGFGGALHRVSSPVKTFLKTWGLLLVLFPNVALSAYFGGKRLPYLFGKESEMTYLDKHYSLHEGAQMLRYLQNNLSRQETVLRLGDIPSSAAYYLPGYHILPMSNYPPDFYAVTTAQFAKALHEKGIDSVLFSQPCFEPQKDGSQVLREIPRLGLRVPPLEPPYFKKKHETAQSTLYQVVWPEI